jgi:class 3 adenylate cyclase
MEFTVLGDPVNIAQRLESMCEPGKVWVGEETFQQTQNLFRFRDLGQTSVKGRKQTIHAYEVIA